jgi:DNA-cytosine methyltransferase
MINVLSLFDGLSGTQLALKNVGIKVNNYYASEVDKFAIKVTQANFPNTHQLGDITKINGSTFNDTIDLLVAGFPCQDLSLASHTGEGLKGSRSGLFYEAIRLLNEIKPKYFLFENVRMSKANEKIITDILGVEPIIINSSLVTAQNRVRYYWTNLELSEIKDQNIKLKDILENGYTDRDLSYCIDANYHKIGGDNNQSSLRSYFLKYRRQLIFNKGCQQVGKALELDHINYDAIKRVYGLDGKSPTLTTMGGGHREPKVVTHDVAGGALTDVIHPDFKDLRWRKLTPLECERLQNVPDNYTNHVSKTQRYRMLGNGFTVGIIEKFVENITIKSEPSKQYSLWGVEDSLKGYWV